MLWTWQLLRAGAFGLDGGSMFGVVPKSLWSGLTPPDDANRIPLQTNCLLLTDGPATVLIETGYGDKWSDRERGFYDLERRTVLDALREVDVAPDDIDLVVVTHLHFDHAGGLTHLDASGAPVSSFPNADIVVQRTEWRDALANKSTMTRTYLRTHLDPIAHQVRTVDGETALAPGLTVWPMPGHTWGQQAVSFRDADGVVCFPGDVMPTRAHVGPAFNMAYDMLPHRNMQSKTSLLQRAAEESWRLVIDHEPGAAVVRVEEDAERPGRYALIDA
ncbi:MAG: MBL fold metallo-hydrolase [Planctomycetota bacterium]|jgi:glyoxylase-like metal-dependent hydrolase (beta-lactamase superfamily II)